MKPTKRYYYVDEAGDGTLFSKQGRVIIGQEGCSRYFILGLLDISDPNVLSQKLETLRADLLADPYFKGVPSLQPEAGKTTLSFHAKDDPSEIRREVYTLLRSQEGLRFFAVVRDKLKVLEYVRQRNERESAYRYHPNELYDALIRRLFRDRLHQEHELDVYFAKRGKSDRTIALQNALEMARRRFQQKWNTSAHSVINVIPTTPIHYPALQAVDYFNWALQRFYERHEERYLEYLWPAVHLVHDIDDTRQAQYGMYYTKKRPLTIAAIENR